MIDLMPLTHYTQDELMRWALAGALENRREFIADKSVWSDETLRSETQRLIDTFAELLADKNRRLRPRGETMRLACIYGEIDRQTYIETVCSQPHQAPDARAQREMEMLEALHGMRQKAWGLTGLEKGLLGSSTADDPPARAANRPKSKTSKRT